MTQTNTLHDIDRYQRLIEISRDLASTLDLDTLLRRIIHNAVEISDSETASILLYDEHRDQLYFQVATDLNNETIMRGIIVPAESIAGWVSRHQQPLIVSDVHKDERFFGHVEKALDFDTKSIIAIPLVTKNKLLGVLEVLNKQHGEYNKKDQETLMVLGAQAAVAIENTRLFQQADHIAELVHELRTPLTSITTISYLLQNEDLTDEDRISLAKTVQQEATRLSNLTTRFLDVARLESGRTGFEPSEVNLVKLIRECITIARPKAAERSIQITFSAEPAIPLLNADEDKLKQVILNLLSNAVKYNHDKGKVTIKLYARSRKIIFTISDTGIGIPKSEMPSLFSKFYRSQIAENVIQGTGLGLSISKKIIERHGGTIEANSEESVGTTFTVSLPIRRRGPRSSKQ